jgi:putative DeoR family transcriptional regulator (stage III sporulation protein D)
MKQYIEIRANEIADYVMATHQTIRETSEVFGVSKSTVHKDLVDRLPQINSGKALHVRAVLETHKDERASRGGKALWESR